MLVNKKEFYKKLYVKLQLIRDGKLDLDDYIVEVVTKIECLSDEKDSFTEDEVLELLVKERQRGVDIAYQFKERADKNGIESLRHIYNRISEECRLVGNAISGLTGLSHAVNETIRDCVKRDYFKK